jgi:repressor LexA
LSLPLLGRIAAGTPIVAIENKQFIDLEALLPTEGHFILEVNGDSMIDEGILNGDLVICKHTQQAREGDIVVALIDEEEATLKSLSYKIQDRLTLIPANPALKPKAYLPHRVQIQGVFTGLLRLKR